MQTPKNDDILVREALRGSREAMHEIYDRHAASIFSYVYWMTGDRHAAEDILHDTFLDFSRQLANYASRGKLSGYLTRIARNKALDWDKDRRRAVSAAASEPATGRTPVEELEKTEIEEKVRSLIRDLPDHLREVVVLRAYRGLSYGEIAGIQGIGEPTARSRMRYALEAMSEGLRTD
jgi:RNA polymerase sigma-70 factor (ECF subfamily)